MHPVHRPCTAVTHEGVSFNVKATTTRNVLQPLVRCWDWIVSSVDAYKVVQNVVVLMVAIYPHELDAERLSTVCDELDECLSVLHVCPVAEVTAGDDDIYLVLFRMVEQPLCVCFVAVNVTSK